MLRYAQGNLLKADAEALVNTVNTVGVSGTGLALMFRQETSNAVRVQLAVGSGVEIARG